MDKTKKGRSIFITVKAKAFIAGVLSLLAVVTICVMLSLAVSPAADTPSNGLTVVVDAGHGGIDGGVTGKTAGVKESDINLAIAIKLRDLLLQNGYTVVMTREHTDGLYGAGVKNKKLSDMQKRRDIINAAAPDIVISIHQNSYPLSSVKGAQVFYHATSEPAKSYATSLQMALNAATGNSRVQKSADYYILNCTEYASVIVECGFLSNPEEEALLVTAAYQEKLSYAIYTGVQTIFALSESAQTAAELDYSRRGI